MEITLPFEAIGESDIGAPNGTIHEGDTFHLICGPAVTTWHIAWINYGPPGERTFGIRSGELERKAKLRLRDIVKGRVLIETKKT